jgi:hypothetical protein
MTVDNLERTHHFGPNFAADQLAAYSRFVDQNASADGGALCRRVEELRSQSSLEMAIPPVARDYSN